MPVMLTFEHGQGVTVTLSVLGVHGETSAAAPQSRESVQDHTTMSRV